MRLTPDNLAFHLKKEFLPIYVIYGNEPFLIEESARAIREAFQAKALGERETFTIEGSSNQSWDELQQAIQNRSLFSSTRLIDVRLTNAKILAKEAALLETILLSSDQDTFFLLQLGSLSKTQQQSKWFLTAEKSGATIAHWPLTESTFSRWIENRLKQKQLSLPPNTVQLLMYHTEGNCLAAAQEIDRLALLYSQDNKDSLTFFEQQNQFDVFDLIEAALKQNASRVVQILHALKTAGIAMQLIFWSLSQTLRILAQCQATDSETQRRHIFARAGIRPPLQPLYLKRLNINPPPCEALLAHLFNLDKMLKTGEEASSWHEIAAISLQLSGISNSVMKFD